MSGLCHQERKEWRYGEEGTYFSKSGAKSAALDSLVKPVTYNVFFGIEGLGVGNSRKFVENYSGVFACDSYHVTRNIKFFWQIEHEKSMNSG